MRSTSETHTDPHTQRMKIKGTIVHNDLEGGFWGILGDDDKKYRPVEDLPDAVCKDGLRVEADLQPANVMSFTMWGQNVRVNAITPIED
jgi:inhibitor of cysteine peptidase